MFLTKTNHLSSCFKKEHLAHCKMNNQPCLWLACDFVNWLKCSAEGGINMACWWQEELRPNQSVNHHKGDEKRGEWKMENNCMVGVLFSFWMVITTCEPRCMLNTMNGKKSLPLLRRLLRDRSLADNRKVRQRRHKIILAGVQWVWLFALSTRRDN